MFLEIKNTERTRISPENEKSIIEVEVVNSEVFYKSNVASVVMKVFENDTLLGEISVPWEQTVELVLSYTRYVWDYNELYVVKLHSVYEVIL